MGLIQRVKEAKALWERFNDARFHLIQGLVIDRWLRQGIGTRCIGVAGLTIPSTGFSKNLSRRRPDFNPIRRTWRAGRQGNGLTR
ncbi:hypothetical protein AXG89_33860 (plasmid) [Burkholderia sp. PAMC 26561]|nr:hypothetical protein AXG89_33860 [Burkholderia sp. PAMC 26561]